MASGNNSRRASDVEPAGDPLGRYRAMLVAGSPFKEWAAGKATCRGKSPFPGISGPCDAGGGKRSRRAGAQFPASAATSARRGAREKENALVHESSRRQGGRLLRGQGPRGERRVLCGECNSRADAVALKDALNALLRCAARWPHRLASGNNNSINSKSRDPWCGRGCPASHP